MTCEQRLAVLVTKFGEKRRLEDQGKGRGR